VRSYSRIDYGVKSDAFPLVLSFLLFIMLFHFLERSGIH